MIQYGRDYPDTGQWQDEDGTVHAANGHRPGVPRGVVVRLSDVEPESVTWVWDGHLPTGKLVVLDGDPALGKSTLAITFAAHISTGKAWPDGAACPRGDVVYLSAEDGLADTIRPRLDAAGGDPERVHALTGVRYLTEEGDEHTRLPTLADVAVLGDIIGETGALLLVVDVFMAYLPSNKDSHRDQDVRSVLHQIAELAERTGCTVLLLRHLNKAGSGSPLYRGGGSIGIAGAARGGFMVGIDPDDDSVRVMACTKQTNAPKPKSLAYRLEPAPGSHVAQVVWVGESERGAVELLAPSESDEDRTERDDAAAWMDGYLIDQGGAAPARDVLAAGRQQGYSRSTVYRASDKLKVRKSKNGMRGPWTWRHPADRHEGANEGTEDSRF